MIYMRWGNIRKVGCKIQGGRMGIKANSMRYEILKIISKHSINRDRLVKIMETMHSKKRTSVSASMRAAVNDLKNRGCIDERYSYLKNDYFYSITDKGRVILQDAETIRNGVLHV